MCRGHSSGGFRLCVLSELLQETFSTAGTIYLLQAGLPLVLNGERGLFCPEVGLVGQQLLGEVEGQREEGDRKSVV